MFLPRAREGALLPVFVSLRPVMLMMIYFVVNYHTVGIAVRYREV